MEFGLVQKAVTIEDKYPNNPIISLPTYEENKGLNTKISFNEKAYELLGLVWGEENEIAFSTSKADLKKTFLINANNYDSHANVKLRKNGTYSNKNNFKILKKRFHTDLKDELLLEIVKTDREFDGQTIYELKKFIPAEEMTPKEISDAIIEQEQEIL